MSDKMLFPKTIQEFIEDYSFKDIAEIYTNGASLIPVFRAEQAIEHYGQELKNNTIDEFISRIEKHMQENWVDNLEYGITWSDIEHIAEQMKGGAE